MAHKHAFFEVKRRFERIHFENPIAGHLNESPVRVLDLALGGARVLAHSRFTPGAAQQLRIEWDKRQILLNCTITRCVLQTLAQSANEKSVYDVGLRITETIGDAHIVMREMIAHFVLKALEEQKANWDGIPPVGPYVHLEGKSDNYKRCEFINGEWKISPTRRPEQPLTGFTISAEVAPHYVDMLCKTYQMTDDEGRRLTRILAELSISKAEGVPTRRYVP